MFKDHGYKARQYFEKGYNSKLKKSINFKCPEDHSYITKIQSKYHKPTMDRVFKFRYDVVTK